MKLDDNGARTDGEPLTYRDYINVPPILTALRVPQEVPKDTKASRWPEWPAGWKPDGSWPRGGNWVHDEALFIGVHQAFEVWFRQILIECGDVLARVPALPLVRLSERESGRLLDERSSPRFPKLAKLVAAQPEDHPLRQMDVPAQFGVDLSQEAQQQLRDLPYALASERLERAALILRVCMPFFDVLETMSPKAFLDFRDRLNPASGFGSVQFRLIELTLGLRELHVHKIPWSRRPDLAAPLAEQGWELTLDPKHPAAFSFYNDDELASVIHAFARPSLRDLVYGLLSLEHPSDSEVDDLCVSVYGEFNPPKRDASEWSGAYSEMSALLAEREVIAAERMHHKNDEKQRLLESALALDRALLDWRAQHIRFVETMIGAKPGTGGGGLTYLKKTVGRGKSYYDRAFPALWASRSILTRRA